MARRHAVEVRAFTHDARESTKEKLLTLSRERNKTTSLRTRAENVVRQQQSFENHTAKTQMEFPRGPAEDVITIGLALILQKSALPHGSFLPWKQAEFGMTEQHA
jgi:hypothetical protein